MRRHYLRSLPRRWRAIARVFGALGVEHRQRILLTFDRGERRAMGQFAAAPTLSRPAVRHHPERLRAAGVLAGVRARA